MCYWYDILSIKREIALMYMNYVKIFKSTHVWSVSRGCSLLLTPDLTCTSNSCGGPCLLCFCFAFFLWTSEFEHWSLSVHFIIISFCYWLKKIYVFLQVLYDLLEFLCVSIAPNCNKTYLYIHRKQNWFRDFYLTK